MKTNLILLLMSLVFVITSGLAQNIEGIATYKTQRKVEITLDSTQVNEEMNKRLQEMLKKQFQREYNLEFTNSESVYKEVESLDKPSNMSGGGMQVVIAGSGSGSVLYKNIDENRYANQNESFSKLFLIKDTIEKRDWQLTKETKNIGEYTCFKATYTDTRTIMNAFSSSNDGETESGENSTEEEFTVTAWYTPQIPVSNGPGEYGGLPGLILEVTDGSETILCSRVVINPNDGVKIEEPKKGKEVSSAEFREIMDEKMKEMNERFQGSGRRGEGNHFQIRIGG